ncbi:MAG: D-tyrosyl-tRNA(Tyr) deacylase [Candidatus Altiarchaeales archaeon ex4484_2]|nr:MAG: D-tyrosyl-tRNA(Tyr) deacylase [Candidatus Altiarchaeales archaeon ex4484_2]
MWDKIILYSRKDMAGVNIKSILEDEYDVGNLVAFDDVLTLESLNRNPETLCIVASKHASKSGKPCLTCHSPGNYSTADYGGNPRELSYAPAFYLQKALQLLQEKQEREGINYEVSFESTHHGPTGLEQPVFFVEVGSTKKEWRDLRACSLAAEVINELLSYEPVKENKAAIGLGGGHYCRKFTRIKDYAIGHICPKHNLPYLDEVMLGQMVSKTLPQPDVALIEWKGLGKEKKRVTGLLENTGLEIVRV